MIVQHNLTPKEIVGFLNSCYKKKNGQKITINDVQGYIKREQTPKWLGDYIIKRNKNITGVKLYHLATLDFYEI